MPIMLRHLYHALLKAGAGEDLASQAAEETAQYDNRFAAIEGRLSRIEERLEGGFRLAYWMAGTHLAVSLGILWKVFK